MRTRITDLLGIRLPIGDVGWGKTAAGQSAGLIDDILPAGELVERLMAEFAAALAALNKLHN